MLTDTEIAYLKSAWEQYLHDHNRRSLLASVKNITLHDIALRFFMWNAVGANDLELIKMLEKRGVDFNDPDDPDPDYAPGLLCAAMTDFGDVPHAIEWLLARGARIDVRGQNDWTQGLRIKSLPQVMFAWYVATNQEARSAGGMRLIATCQPGGTSHGRRTRSCRRDSQVFRKCG